MKQLAPCLLLAALSGCPPNFELPAGANVRCEAGACPGDWVCVEGFCRDPSLPLPEIPSVAVSFVSPADGAVDVSVAEELVVAFNFDVVADSVPGLVSLAPLRDGGPATAVGLTTTPTGLGNVFRFIPSSPLEATTTYQLVIREGVQPKDAGQADPMATAFRSTFATGLPPDLTPPDAAFEGVVVEVLSETSARLTWTLREQVEGDVAGILVVRREGGAAEGETPARQNYAIGAPIGSAEVIASTHGGEWLDVTRKPGVRYGYALYAFDGASNYTAAFLPPFVSAESAVWCTDLKGTARVDADQGLVNFLSGADSDADPATPLVAGGWAPATDRVFDRTSLAAQPGSKFRVRATASTSQATFKGPVTDLWAAGLGLALVTPQTVNLDRDVEVGFEPMGWPAFEGQVDADPSPGAERWGATAGFAAPPFGFRLPGAGAYRVRVRPTKPGCPALAPEEGWTVSAEFETGTLLYVRPGGDDADDGKAIATAKKTIAGALDAVRAGQASGAIAGQVDVLVAEGDYPEEVVVPRDTRLLGGYATGFDARDPAAHVSRVNPTMTGRPSGGFVGAVTIDGWNTLSTMSVEGFLIHPEGEVLTGELEGIYVAGTAALVAHNVVEMDSISGESTGIMVYGATGARVEHNVVRGLAPWSTGVGVQEGAADVIGNELRLQVGIQLAGGALGEVRDNHVVLPPVAGVTGILVQGKGPLRIHDNTVEADGTGTTFSYGIRVQAGLGADVRVERNTVHAGSAPDTIGVDLWEASLGVQVVNNLINGGQGGGGYHMGVHCQYGAPDGAVVANNTIFVGSPVGIAAAFMTNGCALEVVDNLVFGEGTWTGFFEQSLPSVKSLENNVFLTSSAPRSIVTSASDLTGPAFDQAMAQLCADGIPATGNAVDETPWSEVFVAPFPTSSRSSFAGCDWRLKPGAPAVVRAGGKDASASACGGVADSACGVTGNVATCGAVTADFDGKARSVPWSVGAFQP